MGEYLKPLVLRQIAERLELHESTISRVTLINMLILMACTIKFFSTLRFKVVTVVKI